MTPTILALALGAFAIGTSEFAAMGLLPFFAADLGLSEPQAGHVISAYALGVVIGAPLTSILGARLPRRRYLAALMAFYAVVNGLAAVLPGYGALAGTRFLAGLPHGGYLGVAMLMGADAMPPGRGARGAAQVMLGLTVANIVGVPLAGWMGQDLGWRWGFALPAVLAAASAALIWLLAPRGSGTGGAAIRARDELAALANPSVIWVLAVAGIGFGGVFAVYAFMTAALLATTDAPGWAVPLMLAMFGVGGTLGTLVVGRLVEPWGIRRSAYACLGLMAATQLLAGLAVGHWVAMIGAAFAISLGAGLVIPLQSRLAQVAGPAQSMAAAMNHAAFNAANALGPLVAGAALAAGWGWRSTAWVGAALTLAGLAILTAAVRYDRRPW